MSLNIIIISLAVIMNVITLGIVIGGIIFGKKNGFLYEFLKLVTFLALGVGVYFIMPTLSNLCLKINFINNLIEDHLLTLELLHSLVFTLTLMICYSIETLIFVIIRRNKFKHTKILVASTKDRKYVNTAKVATVGGINKKETKKLRKEQKKLIKQKRKQEKELLKLNQKQLTKSQKVFGVIFGIIISLIIGFVVTMPLKTIFKSVAATQPSASEITKSYEYTIYGQVDNLTDVIDFITK